MDNIIRAEQAKTNDVVALKHMEAWFCGIVLESHGDGYVRIDNEAGNNDSVAVIADQEPVYIIRKAGE